MSEREDAFVALVRELAERDPGVHGPGITVCLFCGAMEHGKPPPEPQHTDACLWARARRCLQRYDEVMRLTGGYRPS